MSSSKRARGRSRAKRRHGEAAAGGAGAAAAPSPLAHAPLHDLRIDKTHTMRLYECMRHAVDAPPTKGVVTGSPRVLALSSPRSARSPRVQPGAESGSAHTHLTRPLEHATLGVREIRFTRRTGIMAIATAKAVYVWRGPDAIRDGGARTEQPQNTWTCDAVMRVDQLPSITGDTHAVSSPSLASVGSISFADSPSCPWRSCRQPGAGRSTRLRPSPAQLMQSPASAHSTGSVDEDTAAAAATSAAAPVVLLQLSHDESHLLIAVNRVIAVPPNADAATTSSPNMADASSPLFAADVPPASPALTAATASPSLRSPRTSRSPAIAARSSPGAGTGSQSLEADFDALFDSIDTDQPHVDATQTEETGTKRQRSRAKSKIAKDGSQAPPKIHDALSFSVRHEVYALRLLPFASVGSDAHPSVASSALPARRTATSLPILPSQSDDLLDSMMDELLGDGEEQKQSTTPGAADTTVTTADHPVAVAKEGASHQASSCGHLRLLFSIPHGMTALLSVATDAMLVGDDSGVITLWRRSGALHGDQCDEQWRAERTFAAPSDQAPAAVKSIVAAPTRTDNNGTFVAVHANGDIRLWRIDDDRPLRTLSAAVDAREGVTPAAATPPRTDEAPTADAPFVVSPTTSTPSGRSGQSTPDHAADSSRAASRVGMTTSSASEEVFIPETQFTPSGHTRAGMTETQMSGVEEQNIGITSASGHHRPVVHSVQPFCASDDDLSLRLLMILSAPRALTVHQSDDGAGASIAPNASQSSVASRRSTRRSGAEPSTIGPPLLCPATLTSLVAIELELDAATAESGVDAHSPAAPCLTSFQVPLLLSDDNSSVHTTAVAASVQDRPSFRAKQQRLNSGATASPSVPAFVASGLSSGALVIHSAATGRLMAMMSDAPTTAPQPDGMEDAPTDETSLYSACDTLLAADAHACILDADEDESQQPSPALSSPRSRRRASPRPTAAHNSPRTALSTASGRKRKMAHESGAHTDPHSSTSDGLAASACPSCAPSTMDSRRHWCHRSITAMAFHPIYNLLAVGDQKGHLHIYAPTAPDTAAPAT